MRWQWIMRGLLAVQATLLVCLFWWGPRSWPDVAVMQHKLSDIQRTVHDKELVVAQLIHEESQWKTDLFNKERIAREELQMARAGDTVYYR